MALKHIGRMKNNQRKVIVAYRTVPGEPENCIVVTTENLMAEEHDTLMKLVESNAGQTANELAEAMARSLLPDGRNMLAGFHTTGKMIKVPTNTVEMTPDTKTVLLLSDLNQIIAQQKGVSVEDLAIGSGTAKTETAATVNEIKPVTEAIEPVTASEINSALSDEDLAKQLRSQADAMFKEAQRLRKQAEELAPTKKKTEKTAESA